MQREGQQGKQAPQKGDRGENAQQKGSSQAQEREGPKGKQQVQKEQQGQKEQPGKQQGQKERTEGQGGSRTETQKGAEPKGKAGERTDGQGGGRETQKGAEPKGKAGERTEGQRERTEGQQKGERTDTRSGGSVTLTTEQRTRVRETVLRGSNAPRVNNVNFSIRVGTVVPTSVHIVEVAPVLVEVHPQWRGFFYFIVNDQIIIVDRNHHIVAVLDV